MLSKLSIRIIRMYDCCEQIASFSSICVHPAARYFTSTRWDMAETNRNIELIGAPVDVGAGRRGCIMGSEALRVAELEATLASLGYRVADCGNVVPVADPSIRLEGAARNAAEIAGWTRAL